MPGNSENASLWADADVYISTNLAAPLPASASAPFSAAWSLVGLLDGGDGFQETRTEDVKDHYAWGGLIVRTSRRNFKLVKGFSVLEDNPVTRAVIWPGSSSSAIIVPRPAKVKIAFELREGGKVRRLVTRNYAQIDVDGKIGENETDLTKVALLATIFPDANGVLFDPQEVAQIATLAITPLTLAVAVGAIKALVATVTYADATTAVITGLAQWSTTAPTVATAAYGFVSGVGAGTASVSATYGGVAATAPSVITVS